MEEEEDEEEEKEEEEEEENWLVGFKVVVVRCVERSRQ